MLGAHATDISDRLWEAVGRSQFVSIARTTLTASQRATGVSVTGRTVKRWQATIADRPLYDRLASPTKRTIVLDTDDSVLLGWLFGMIAHVRSALITGWSHAAVRRCRRRIEEKAREAPIQVASCFVLVLLALSVAMAWERATQAGLGTASVLAGVVVLGFRDDRTWEELRETRMVGLLVNVVVPSERSQR